VWKSQRAARLWSGNRRRAIPESLVQSHRKQQWSFLSVEFISKSSNNLKSLRITVRREIEPHTVLEERLETSEHQAEALG